MTCRQLVVLLFSSLIALQSWAAVSVPCSMSVMDSDPYADSMDHHAHHGMVAMTGNSSSTESAGTSCCEEGYCSQNGCAGIAFLLSAAGFGSALLRDTVYLQPGSALPDWSPGAVFHPPTP